MPRLVKPILLLMLAALSMPAAYSQDQSVKPGINDTFRDPDPQEFLGKFEVESREVFARRKEIVAVCEIQPGQTVADIGAGTGLFTRMFADTVGKDGRVILIDFRRVKGTSTDWVMNHVRAGQEVFEAEIIQAGFKNVHEERELLKENYFVVFEKPASVSSANDHRPGRGRGMGRGPGPDMRADQDVFHFLLDHHAEIRRSVKRLDNGVETLTESDNKEVAAKIQEHVASMHGRVKEGRGLRFWDELFVAIFKKYDQIKMTVEKTEKGVKVVETSGDKGVVLLIQAHADVVSQFVAHGLDEAHKNHPVPAIAPAATKLEFPIIPKHGGVLPRPKAVEQPRAGAKVVFDATADAKPADVNKGLDRVARLLNLYGVAGLQAQDVKITIVLHGEATKSVLNAAAYKERFQVEQNPNLPLIRTLQKAGVEVLVCGQALNYKGFPDGEVVEGIPIAAAALAVVINKQSDGYSYIPVP